MDITLHIDPPTWTGSIHLHLSADLLGSSASQQFDSLHAQLSALQAQVTLMDAGTQAKLDALNAAVAQETSVEGAVETLLTGLSAQIAALKTGVTDPAVLAAIDSATGIVTANNAKFAAAVVANTPA